MRACLVLFISLSFILFSDQLQADEPQVVYKYDGETFFSLAAAEQALKSDLENKFEMKGKLVQVESAQQYLAYKLVGKAEKSSPFELYTNDYLSESEVVSYYLWVLRDNYRSAPECASEVVNVNFISEYVLQSRGKTQYSDKIKAYEVYSRNVYKSAEYEQYVFDNTAPDNYRCLPRSFGENDGISKRTFYECMGKGYISWDNNEAICSTDDARIGKVFCYAPFEWSPADQACIKWCPDNASDLDLILGLCKPKPGEVEPDACPTLVGNPIQSSTGEKIELQSPDYSGSGVFPIQFTRNYRSYRAPEVQAPPPINREATTWVKYIQPAGYAGAAIPHWVSTFNDTLPPVGYKQWQHNYQLSLVAYPDLSKLVLVRANGDRNIYSVQSDAITYLPENLTGGTVIKSDSQWQFIRADGVVETYSSDGQLLTLTNQQGMVQTLAYAESGLLQSVTEPTGRKLTFTYDENSRLSTMVAPNGATTRYEYDEMGNLTKVVHPDSTADDLTDNPSTAYQYEDANHPFALTGEIDGNGNIKANWTYGADGRAIGSVNNKGFKQTSVSYEEDAVTVTEANGHQRTLSFDEKGRLSSMTGGNCGQCRSSDVASYTYDSRNFLTAAVDFNGVETRYEYNSRGLQTKRTKAFDTTIAQVIITEWHEHLSLPTKVTTPTLQTEYGYGVRGRLESITETDLVVTDNPARVTAYTYHDNGLLATIDGPRTDVDDVTSFTYDEQFDLVSVTDAAGNVTTITERNANGYPTAMTDPNGVITTLTYDVRNRLISQTSGEDSTQFAYDKIGQLIKVTLPTGAATEYTYNGARLLTQVADGQGNHINYTYDVMGNVTKVEVKDPEGTLHASQQQVFDDLNRVTLHIDGLSNSTVYGYDAVGNQTRVKSPMEKETKQVFDALNRLTETEDAKAGKTSYGYDAANNLTLVKAPNSAQTTYRYDGFGNLLSQTSPDTGKTYFTYDEAGNQLSKTDAKNSTVNYRYDALNRLIGIDYPDDTLDITLTYDAGTNGKGRLSAITDGSGTTNYSYNTLGQVSSKVSTITGKSFTVGYAYNGAGQLTQITQPSGRVVSLTRNSNGRITGVEEMHGETSQNLLTNATYAPFGSAQSFTLGNGTMLTKTHNLNGQIASINVDDIFQSSIGYSADSQITALASSLAQASNQRFSYDELDRLTQATGNYGTLAYSYDSASNRISKTDVNSTQTLSYLESTNQLTTPYIHDANGNRTQDSLRRYSYGEHNRLTEVVNDDMKLNTTYLYNGLGQRVKKSNLFGEVYFIYDEQGLLIAEADKTGRITKEYVYFEGQPLVMLVGE